MTRKLYYAIALVLAVGAQVARADTKAAVVNVAGVSEKYAKTADLEAQFDAVRWHLPHGVHRTVTKDDAPP